VKFGKIILKPAQASESYGIQTFKIKLNILQNVLIFLKENVFLSKMTYFRNSVSAEPALYKD